MVRSCVSPLCGVLSLWSYIQLMGSMQHGKEKGEEHPCVKENRVPTAVVSCPLVGFHPTCLVWQPGMMPLCYVEGLRNPSVKTTTV